jgi:hypothetical protein
LTSSACTDPPVIIGVQDLTTPPLDASEGATAPADASNVSADASDSEIVDATMDSTVADGSLDADSTPIPESGGVSPPDGSMCTGDLSNISTGDFHVSFTVNTRQTGVEVALVNQRSICMGSTFWDIRMSNGNIRSETDNLVAGHYTNFFSVGQVVNDGIPHTVLLSRVSGLMNIYIDGVWRGGGDDGGGRSTSSFGALTPVRKGFDVCTGSDGTIDFDPLNATISDLCVAAR